MSRKYFIYDGSGAQQPRELDLPIRAGGANHKGIVIPGVAADQLLATIALADGHAYIQPAESAGAVFHNGEQLSASAWLKSGDRVQLAGQVLAWDIHGDRVTIRLQAHTPDEDTPRPPTHAPPAATADALPVADVPAPEAGRKHLRRSVIAFVSLLLLLAVYLLAATSVTVKATPASAVVELAGFPPAISFGGARLVWPGRYRLQISAAGYVAVDTELQVSMGPPLDLSYTLAEKPGIITIQSAANNDLQLFVDGVETPANPQGKYEIEGGSHSLRIESARYLPQQQDVDVEGLGVEQTVTVPLQPAWAVVSFSTSPTGADVRVDDQVLGSTPLQAEILQGRHELRLEKPGFKPVTRFETIQAGVDRVLDEVQLQPLDGRLMLSSTPAGASILIDGQFLGQTPQSLELAAEMDHQLSLSKTGYQTAVKHIRLAADKEQALAVSLEAEYGTVFLQVRPAGASLTINGQKSAKSSGRLRLQTRRNTLLVSKPGYVSQKLTITPKAGVSQNVKINLVSEAQELVQKQEAATPGLLTTAGGQTLSLIRPADDLHMGASRSDAGRRANESRRLIRLQRPFYLAHKEVTNAEFRRFRPSHDSGSVDSAALNGDDQPVVNVSWEDAARYCNWLSQQAGLPLAYIEDNGSIRASKPMTTGFRLPTEAEWAWVARRAASASEQRYPWQGGFPPPKNSGNYADARISDTLADTVPGYDDGYRGTAPVGSFPAWPQLESGGFYDLGGNAAEWIHDFYAIYPGEANKLLIDPMGPDSGKHHVVRGAGWRNGSFTELRLSYRSYSNKPRYDLGFRIARYAE